MRRNQETPRSSLRTSVLRAGALLLLACGLLAAPAWAQHFEPMACFHQDALGSVRLVTTLTTSANSYTVSRHDYLPFGEEITPGTFGRTVELGYGADTTPHRFTGKERDTESNLDYFGARYYSGAQGRFTSADEPFADQDPGDPQSWNLYAYVRNQPLSFVDPDGREGLFFAMDRDNRALLARQISDEQFLARQRARGVGGLVGGTLALGVELWPLRGAIGALLYNTAANPRNQEIGVGLLEDAVGMSPGTAAPGLGLGAATRLTRDEIATGTRLAKQEGLELFESSHVGSEVVDTLGRTYDFLGKPAASKHWNPGQFFGSIKDHLRKSNDFTVIDLTGFTDQQIKATRTFVDSLTEAERATIKRIGF